MNFLSRLPKKALFLGNQRSKKVASCDGILTAPGAPCFGDGKTVGVFECVSSQKAENMYHTNSILTDPPRDSFSSYSWYTNRLNSAEYL